MLEVNKQEVEEKIKSLFAAKDCPRFSFDWGRDYCFVEISCESTVDLTFQEMLRVSEIFGTDRINLGSEHRWGGCETCDYGARYEVDFTVLGVYGV